MKNFKRGSFLPRQRRKIGLSKIYHVIARGNERKDIFLDDEDKNKFIQIIINKKKKNEYILYVYCLMNNHLHLLLKEEKDNISRIMRRINTAYAYYFNKKYNRVGHVFQNRFRSEPVENDRYLISLIRYIHNNPVKAKIVNQPHQYKWSSYSLYLREQKSIINKEEILNFFSADKSKAIRLFTKFCCQQNNDIFMDYQEVFREVKEITSVEKAKKYVSRYLKEKGLQIESLKDKVNKEYRDELIIELKEKTNLSYREMANILGFSREVVEKRVNKK
jgi:REP element-mobilizing transposase RayT/biotin operon repressor